MKARPKIRWFYDLLEQPLYTRERVIRALLVVLLLAAFLLPLWRISMEAPQYPAGLSMDIYPHKVVGGHGDTDIAEINILNHYIGMRKIDRASLTDLGWMPFAIGGLAIFTLRVAVVGNVRSLVDLAVITGYVCIFAFSRFVYMLYTYGHHLDPDAPVKVPGFTPALFGTKHIANFTTHSYPQAGAFAVASFAAGVCAIVIWHVVASRRRGAPAPEEVVVAEEAPAPA